MKSAIVTGASSGIGLEISRLLLELDYKVYGISRYTKPKQIEHDKFVAVSSDLSEEKDWKPKVEAILKEEKELSLLVNNAGIGALGLHEEIEYNRLRKLLELNFCLPILLTRLCLRRIKENAGLILNISSTSALKASPIGAAYGASKAGLTSFGQSIFEEVRKTGTRVVNIHPDITRTHFFDELNFQESEDRETFLLPEDIADVVKFIIERKKELVITDITIKPQKHRLDKKRHNKELTE
ncbi:MAG: SDR family oxidoreductase [Leptospiraceae bacterium]|nr:SDR family oxidoreductase [Leptospiraceae bacterium]MCP5498941.1 SDR family oxidoreductase [Leptospiraceae bacterium]